MDEEDIAFIYGFGIPQEKKINWGIGRKNKHLEIPLFHYEKFILFIFHLFIFSRYFHRAHLPLYPGFLCG